MNYIDRMLDRASLYQLSSFLIFGAETHATEQEYRQWKKSTHEDMLAALRAILPDPEELEKITNLIYSYTSTVECLYMEIGIKAGAQLILELLHTTPQDPCV